MKQATLIEDVLFEAGVPSLCLEADSEIADLDPEEKSGQVYELMVPKSPATSIMALLKKNKSVIDKEMGKKKYYLKIRSFHYFFSYLYFRDYMHKDGMKSFLSISSSEAGFLDGKLQLNLKIAVIGKPAEALVEEIEYYLFDKLVTFNSITRFALVANCQMVFKDDPFTLLGEPEPEYYELDLNPLIHNIEYN